MAGRNLFADDPVNEAPAGGRNLFAEEGAVEQAKVEQPQAEQPLSIRDRIMQRFQNMGSQAFESVAGAVEPAISVGSGMVADTVSNIGGGIQAVLNPDNPMAGPESRDRIRNTLTYQPRSETGQRVMQGYGEILAPVGEMIEKARLGDEVLEAGGPEWLAKNAEAIPEYAGAAIAGLGLRKPSKPPVKLDKAGNVVSGLDERAINLRNNPSDVSTAKVKLSDTGRVIKDPIGKAALNQGWSDLTVSGVKSANPATKTSVRRMVDIAKNRGKDISNNIRTRPSDVLGDALYKKYQFLEQSNKSAGKQLDSVARSLGKKGVQVDMSAPMKWLFEKLDESGVSIGPDGKVDFSQSSLPKSDFGLIKENIGQIQRVLKQENNFYNAHKLKQILRRTGLSYEQTVAKKGASPDTQNLFKGLSGKIDEVLDSQSKAYDNANIKFGETAEVLNSVKKVAKDNLFLDSADKFLGKTMRRITSNAVSRDGIVDMLDNIDAVTSKYGGKFDEDLFVLQHVAREMDDVIDVAAKTSIQGELGPQAIAQGLERSSVGHLAQAVEKGAKLIGHKSKEKALNTLNILAR